MRGGGGEVTVSSNNYVQVEAIIREDLVIEAYDILELLCETILARLPLMGLSPK